MTTIAMGNVVDFATVTIDLQRRGDEFVRRALGRPVAGLTHPSDS